MEIETKIEKPDGRPLKISSDEASRQESGSLPSRIRLLPEKPGDKPYLAITLLNNKAYNAHDDKAHFERLNSEFRDVTISRMFAQTRRLW